MWKYCFLGVLYVCCICSAYSQSETVIVYDNKLTTAVGSIVIPFDKKFTFLVPGCNTQYIRKIFVHQAHFSGGFVQPVIDDKVANQSIPDLIFTPSGGLFDFDTDHDTLSIHFPALKPEKLFMIVVIRSLTNSNLKKAYALNEALRTGDANKIKKTYDALKEATHNDEFRTDFLALSQSKYQTFYTSKLSSFYVELHTGVNYRTSSFLSIAQLNTLSTTLTRQRIKFKDLGRLSRIINEGKIDSIFNGCKTVKYVNAAEPTDSNDFTARVSNISASLVYFDTLTNAVEQSLAIENDTDLQTIRAQLKEIADVLAGNKKFIEDNLKKINEAIEKEDKIQEADILVSTTTAKDLKTQGGNRITMDLGVANISVWDAQNKFVYMPKPYYGVNIYFRPIDRNSRNKDFPHRRYQKSADMDYNIATYNCFWQHLSLSVGLTFGDMSNSQFDNLIGNGVLLVGPAYRFGRFLKVGAGTSLLKRENKNKLISNKTVAAGLYVSLAADIDLVQGVRDFTNLFK